MKAILTFLFFAALSCASAAVPVISSPKNTTFTLGVPGRFSFTATNPPLTNWQVTSGALPASLTLDADTGTLSGTPALGEEGAYAFSVTVDNASGTSLPQSFTLLVRGAIVIVKYNTAATWTRYQADDLQTAKPYAHKALSGSEGWSRYEILNLNTGTFRIVSYDTTYDRGVAIKRYDLDPNDYDIATSPYAFASYYRAGGTNAAPTYRWQNEFSGSSSEGGPEDPVAPSNYLYRFEFMYYVGTAPLAMTTIIPATTVPIAAAVKALVPIGATGTDTSYYYFASYPNDAPGTPPDSIMVEFSSAAPTVNYDSVLSANANKTAPTAASLVDYDGTTLTPQSTAYAVKLVRDALELLGYEKR